MIRGDDVSPVVEARGVTKTYRPFPWWLAFLARSPIRKPIRALDDVSIEVEPGEICAIVGPNGAGKTTFFRILIGLTTADAGQARVGGLDPATQGRRVRRLIGWMPSDTRTLFGRQTCRENLWFHGRLQAMGRQELRGAIPQILDQVGLGAVADNTVFGLSAGMRQRLLLARALLHRPRLLLLDEPTGAIDPIAAHGLLGLIRRIVDEEHLAAMISSHRLEEIEALQSRAVLLDRGRIRFDGDLGQLRRELGGRLIRLSFDLPGTAEEAVSRLESYPATVEDCDLLVSTESEPVGEILQRLGDLQSRLARVTEEALPLRDVLVQVYGDAP